MNAFKKFAIVFSFALLPSLAVAQAVPVSGEGISGTIDKKHRNPVVTVSSSHSGNATKILVDAYVPDSGYADMPIRFDFYINRALFTSQIRSTELPGPIGIDVPDDVATPPFEYAVAATVITPNRQFASIVNATALATDYGATLNCTLTTMDTDGNTVDYATSKVAIANSTTDLFTFSVSDAPSSDGAETASYSGSLTLSGTSLTGTVTGTAAGSTIDATVNGTAVITDSSLASLETATSDQAIAFSCK